MRILFISAFYPPHVVGGWEQLTQDINRRLQERGHITHVLTSTYGVETPTKEENIDRLLTLQSNIYHYEPRQFLGHKHRLKQDLAHTQKVIERFQPDVIFVHVMWNLSRGIAWLAEQLCPSQVVYYIANNWPHATDPHTAYWSDRAKNPVMNLAKQILAPIPLKIIKNENHNFSLSFEHVLCVSQAVKNDLATQANIPLQNMRVVYNGVETELFVPPSGWPRHRHHTSLSLLYAGSLNAHKGVHTAIQSLVILKQKYNCQDIHLTVVGSGHVDYEASLRQLVKAEGLEDQVHFPGRVPREEMPALLQKFDVLVFPSIWEEPLARMMQEAMAAGLVVVGTLTGGSGELLVEGETGLTFKPEDAAGLAHQIQTLAQNRDLFARLAQQGRQAVLERFDLNRMIDEIEAYLGQVAKLD